MKWVLKIDLIYYLINIDDEMKINNVISKSIISNVDDIYKIKGKIGNINIELIKLV